MVFDVAVIVALVLLRPAQRQMLSTSTGVKLVPIVLILAVCTMSVAQRASSRRPPAANVATGFHAASAAAHTGIALTSGGGVAADEDAEGALDLYGNEVSDAVATYK